MKKYLNFYCVFFFFLLFESNFFGQTNYWMQRAGGLTPDEGIDIAIDAAGNTYTTGYFSGSATFGTATLVSSGVTDVFITKVDNLGIFQWAVKAGGAGADKGLSIKADANGNTYITGFFYGTANFGAQTIISVGVQDIFIAKYDASGILQWAKSAGGNDSDIGNGINVDPSGNVVITGEYKGTASFGSASLSSMNNSIDIFTSKLDPNGNFLWAKKGSAHLTDRGLDVACDASGNIYVTGQFTDTITFDLTHNSNLYNSIFLIKYNSLGQEQWFRKIGGGTLNIAYGIATDANSNIYLTGDFTGSVIFFGPPNTTLTNTYYNRIFVAKYNSAGDLLWAEADGSSAEVTSKNIALDTSGNAYIVGNFRCRLNEYADQYGQGTFNSIGFWDIFVSKYNANGAWQWSRQCGSKQDDNGAGIAVDGSGQIHIAGSFYEDIRFAASNNFNGYNATSIYSTTLSHCGDINYGHYQYFNSAGNSDILIAKNFDPLRQPYDYYERTIGTCVKPYVGVCIDKITMGSICPDSIIFCGSGQLNAISKTVRIAPIGPDFKYLWSTGSTAAFISVTNSGYYSVKQTSADGCFVSTDSIYVTVNPLPPRPVISDDHGINTNALNTIPIVLCDPDSALLTGGNFGSNLHGWNLFDGVDTTWAKKSGTYYLKVKNQYGCENSNSVEIILDKLLPPVIPKMICLEDPDGNDSVTICGGKTFNMFVYDSISNPMGITGCMPFLQTTWEASPDTITYTPKTTCANDFTPKNSGTYQIKATLIRKNYCDIDTVIITKSIYVELLPAPKDTITLSITGNNPLCPGDSLLLTGISSINNYYWFGEDVWGDTTNNVWVKKEGTYYLYSTRIKTNPNGCSLTTTVVKSVQVTYKPQPIVTMNPSSGLICPDDSVQLLCSGSGTFQWQGPSGPIGTNTPGIFVKIPGFYYCVNTDIDGCVLISNTVLVNQYATPQLLASPSNFFCSGDSVLISVITNAGSTIQWQTPLNGSSTNQIISVPGTYTCLITSCGIQTSASITITMSDSIVSINASGPLTFCEGDSVLLFAGSNLSNYIWQPGNYNQSQITVYQSGTYTLSTTDNYGCTATGIPVTVNAVSNNLSAPTVKDTAICPGNSAELTALGTGIIQWYDLPNKGALLNTGSIFNTPHLKTTTTYYIITTDSVCKSPETRVTVSMDNCENIIPPNVFTPNGDGGNDIFYFPIKEGKCFDCKIYNRWGVLIYQWNEINEGWDGTIMTNGKPASDGVYYYILEYCNFIDVKKHQVGFIQLLKKEN
ncbi:MAG: gliding motility-associated C-terminal domain-containing protein [Bacteroidota bacterium]